MSGLHPKPCKSESQELEPGHVCIRANKVLVAHLCLTVCNPTGCSPPGSSVPGVLQVGIQEWVAIPISRGSSRPRDRTRVSCSVGRFFTIWATTEALYVYYAYGYMHMHIHAYTHMHLYTHVWICLWLYTHAYIYVYIHIHIHTYVQTYVYTPGDSNIVGQGWEPLHRPLIPKFDCTFRILFSTIPNLRPHPKPAGSQAQSGVVDWTQTSVTFEGP